STVSSRLARMLRQDQADRQIFADTPASTWNDPEHVAARARMGENDAQRRAEVQEMLDAGEVHEPDDCYSAAMIFQHGTVAQDYLKAHRLAYQAALGGHGPARGLTAATLDRFLLTVEQPQIVGTQYYTNGPCHMDPFDTSLPDEARLALGARTLEQSETLMRAVDQGLAWDEAVAEAARVPVTRTHQPLLQQARAALAGHDLIGGYAMAVAAALEHEPGAKPVVEGAFQQLRTELS
ncbi:MAG: hypothetical protein KC910_04540, partial [Candidatus Eremiobacteraeota bacterium]|nr:hypothetical protein [Candidatus Eremiobacteraeota bacterium]